MEARVFEAARMYASEVLNLLERNAEWWQTAQGRNGGAYGELINISLNVASRLSQQEMDFISGVKAFAQSLTDVYEMTISRSKFTKAASSAGRPGDEVNDRINSVARRTLDQLNRLGPFAESEVSESPAQEEGRIDVKEVQEALKALGFFNSFADGVAGPRTKAAIREFQQSKGLEPTGDADRVTYDLLRAALNPENPGPISPKPVSSLFLPLLKTEGNHRATADKLDFEYDIQSLATVISLEDVKPPLAIGLFGNWGSGKSFFMEKLSEKIQEYSKLETEGFVKNVVQVKFNSWHYSDSNLWASLITEIFDSLNTFSKNEAKEDELEKLSETLNITSAQKEAVEARRNELTDKIEKLSREKALKRSRLEDLSGMDIFRLLLSDPRVGNDLKSLKNEHIEQIIQDGEKLDEYLGQLQELKSSFFYSVNTLRGMKGKRWGVVLLVTVLLLIGVLLVRYLMKDQWFTATQWLAGAGAVLVANVANIIRVLSPVKKTLNEAMERLSSLKRTFDPRAEADSAESDRMKNELESLTLSIAELDKKIADARKEMDDLRSGRKLLDFIEERQRDENYSKQLGLISWIRKDFSKLDELLRKQHELSEADKATYISNPYDVQLKIDRIILYIDDLDRCKEDIVVKVLEAIHLLLAFPLFVVVVGVDPRWLNNALSEKYKNLFGKHYDSPSDKKTVNENGTVLSGAATSYDYLEKIFQIPFSLRQMNTTNRKNLIEYLLRNEMEPDKSSEEGKKTGAPNVASLPGQGSPAVDIQSGTTPSPDQMSVAEKVEEHRQRLTFLKEELECMQNISALFGQSPRTINRFINIYRIIKAHRRLKVNGEFSEDDFAPIMVILSVMIGRSELAQDFIDQLSKSDDELLFSEFLSGTRFPAKLKHEITGSIHPRVMQLPLKLFKENLELISRFSFRTFAVSIA